MYPDKAKEMKRTLLDYIKALKNAHVRNADIAETAEQRKGTLEINENGFPLAPRTHSWPKVTRADLEPLYRLYITHHYRKCRQFSGKSLIDNVRTCMPRFRTASTI